MTSTGRCRNHVEIVAEYGSPKAQRATKDVLQPTSRETGRTRIHAFVNDVRRHDTGHVRCGETRERNEIGDSNFLIGTTIDGECDMRVRRDTPVPREVFSDTADTRIPHPLEKRSRELSHDLGIVMKGTTADDSTCPAIEIEHRRKAEIDAACAKLDGHDPPSGTRGPVRKFRIHVVEPAVSCCCRESAEPFSKSLHPSAFVIDCNQQRRSSQVVNGVAEPTKLFTAPVVPRKENHAADAGMSQHLPLARLELDSRNPDHEGSECHVVRLRPAALDDSGAIACTARVMAPCLGNVVVSRPSAVPLDLAVERAGERCDESCTRLVDIPTNREIGEASYGKHGEATRIDSCKWREVEIDID